MRTIDANKVTVEIIDYFNDLVAQKLLLDKGENQIQDLAAIYGKISKIIEKAPSVDEEIDKRVEEAYQRGLKKAWTAAKRLRRLAIYGKTEVLERLFDTSIDLVAMECTSPEEVMTILDSEERKIASMKETVLSWKKDGFTKPEIESIFSDLDMLEMEKKAHE